MLAGAANGATSKSPWTFRGAPNRVIAVLAHELQHAVEVAQAPEARDGESLEQMFSRLAIPSGCGSTNCYETQASKDVEYAVRDELRGRHASPGTDRSQLQQPALLPRTFAARSLD
jgi:hypothetical protein